MSTTLPVDASKANCDAGTDDPKLALLTDLAGLVDKFNLLKAALGALAQIGVGNGLELESSALGVADLLRLASKETALSATTTLTAAHRGRFVSCTATFTLTLTAAGTLGDGWFCFVRNAGTGVVTIDPNLSETVNGALTLALAAGESAILFCNGTAFKTVGYSADSGVTPGVYGGATAVPVITFDAKGRATACTTAAISSTPPAASVGQSQLKKTTGEVSTDGSANLTLPGGVYGFYPTIRNGTGATVTAQISNARSDLSFTANIYLSGGIGTANAIAQHTYITASPPYNLGNGDIPLFVFAAIDNATGKILSTYVAPDPCWAYNGPTDIRPDYIDPKTGMKYKVKRDESSLPAKFLNKNPKKLALADRDQYLDMRRSLPTVLVEIDQALKQADMPLIPHPFISNDLTGKTVIMLEPVGSMIERLAMLHEDGESVAEMLHGDYLQLDNVPLIGMSTPPGVAAHKVSWK